MKKILINASNLHQGGGVQVATSFISELLGRDKKYDFAIKIIVSSEVDANISSCFDYKKKLFDYEVVDFYGFDFLKMKKSGYFDCVDIIFTIFGPFYYLPFSNVYSIVGFAQSWILYPNNDSVKNMSLFNRAILKVKFGMQKFFFKMSDYLVVESAHVKNALVDKGIFKKEKIYIVKNVYSRIYSSPEAWELVNFPECAEGEIKLGFLGRNYKHKNIEIFGEVAPILKKKYGIRSRLYVTFSEEEWASCGEAFRDWSVNVGPLRVNQCPNFYEKIDALFFPSLLECFSVTPLEAMVMGKKVFASDRVFNRDICADYADYFDPLNCEDISKVIAGYYLNGGDQDELITAVNHAKNFSSPQERADKYMDILSNFANVKNV